MVLAINNPINRQADVELYLALSSDSLYLSSCWLCFPTGLTIQNFPRPQAAYRALAVKIKIQCCFQMSPPVFIQVPGQSHVVQSSSHAALQPSLLLASTSILTQVVLYTKRGIASQKESMILGLIVKDFNIFLLCISLRAKPLLIEL